MHKLYCEVPRESVDILGLHWNQNGAQIRALARSFLLELLNDLAFFILLVLKYLHEK